MWQQASEVAPLPLGPQLALVVPLAEFVEDKLKVEVKHTEADTWTHQKCKKDKAWCGWVGGDGGVQAITDKTHTYASGALVFAWTCQCPSKSKFTTKSTHQEALEQIILQYSKCRICPDLCTLHRMVCEDSGATTSLSNFPAFSDSAVS